MSGQQPAWLKEISKYGKANHGKAIWQLVNTVPIYIGLWVLMVLSIRRGYSYWVTLGLAAVAGTFLIRMFIFFHDCTHDSFFASRKANRILGYIIGVLTFTPYTNWRIGHLAHHATAGDLDRRGKGDMWLMTVEEYKASSRGMRLAYRLYRNPLVMFGIGPAVTFFIVQRMPDETGGKKGRFSVYFTDLALVAMIALGGLTLGFGTFLMIQIPVILLAGVLGIWLFYVQHDFDRTYWARHEEWQPMRASLEGSSYYRLPKILQWLTGNIGIHHVHHVRPRVPNYNLQACVDEFPELGNVEPLTIRRSLKSLFLNVYDEQRGELISFRSMRKRLRAEAA